MLQTEKDRIQAPGFLLGAATAWFFCALPLVLVSALLLNLLSGGERALAYVSSAVSFLAALAAGSAAAGKAARSRIGSGLLSGLFLSVVLLTVGFVLNGEAMDPSAILSVVSFTFAGCLAGAILFSRPANRKRKRMPKP